MSMENRIIPVSKERRIFFLYIYIYIHDALSELHAAAPPRGFSIRIFVRVSFSRTIFLRLFFFSHKDVYHKSPPP